ncbi:DsbA family oxidoreductase [Thermorudis peleae]|uniref:DsbA family oxidoreductase n=1 Tax=Thermorudis peleae TaxID=1382356 RepID=UPI00056EC4D4|nr:DsbA family protein [Thermorudis peleae]
MAQWHDVQVWFDYLCPYVYRASMLLLWLQEHYDPSLVVHWRYFSLEQVNQRFGPDWKLWEQPDDVPSRTRLAWKGAEAARQQGDEAFRRFHRALLRLRHEERRDLADPETIFEAARRAELDLDAFDRAFKQATLAALARDHEEGVQHYGVFGTPTLVFPNGRAAYLRLSTLPEEAKRGALWEQLVEMIANTPEVDEIKRPTPPQPA